MNKNEISEKHKQDLLKLAAGAIVYFLTTGKKLQVVEEKKFQGILSEPRGSFVTIEVNKELHGCIGKIQSEEPLYLDIINNAVEAGFYDPRFMPLTKDDLAEMTIEISLLTIPGKLKTDNEKEIIKTIAREKPGVILKKGYNSATFLPQVWEKISDPVNFLQELSLKAGMDAQSWKDCEIYTYKVESFTK